MKSLTSTPTNLIPAATNYAGGGTYTLNGLVVGQNYQYTKGANDTSCTVTSTSLILAASGVFTATATSVVLTGTGSALITASVALCQPVNLFAGTLNPTLPARPVTVGQFPSNNPNWSRQVQINEEGVFIKRATYAVAISLADLINLALTQEVNLTWTPPVILTQPVAASCVHSSTAATFTVVGGSEYVMSYNWQYSTDGVTWTNASGTVNGTVYTGNTTATLTCTPTTTGQNGVFHRCVVTDNAGSFGLTNGSINSNSAVLTIT